MEIVSLGCGGGRHQVLKQDFKTGGFRINAEKNLHVDPGPGALLLSQELGLSPVDLDAVLVSHSHTDHRTDTEVFVEAMDKGSSGTGRLIGSKSVIKGSDDHSPAISPHHKRKIGELISLKPQESFDLDGMKIEATPTRHSDSTGIGFKIHTENGIFGYTSDTGYFDELSSIFEGTRVLIANVTRPGGRRIDGHLCIEDLIKLVSDVNPEIVMILHMGMLFLRNSPQSEAHKVQEQTGVRTFPGRVGSKIRVNDEIDVTRISRQKGIADF